MGRCTVVHWPVVLRYTGAVGAHPCSAGRSAPSLAILTAWRFVILGRFMLEWRQSRRGPSGNIPLGRKGSPGRERGVAAAVEGRPFGGLLGAFWAPFLCVPWSGRRTGGNRLQRKASWGLRSPLAGPSHFFSTWWRWGLALYHVVRYVLVMTSVALLGCSPSVQVSRVASLIAERAVLAADCSARVVTADAVRDVVWSLPVNVDLGALADALSALGVRVG